MVVYWDIELTHPKEVENFGEQAKYILSTIKEFVKQRIKVLEDEVEKEWSLTNAMIVLRVPTDTTDFGIMFLNYRPSLKEKLQSCITNDDMLYINTVISDGLR